MRWSRIRPLDHSFSSCVPEPRCQQALPADRGVDPFGSAIVLLKQSPFPSVERGTSFASRSLPLREQVDSGSTADLNVQQARVTWTPQGSIAYFVHLARTSGGRSFSFSKCMFVNGCPK